MTTVMYFKYGSHGGALELNMKRLECGHVHRDCDRCRIKERRRYLVERTLQAMVCDSSARPDGEIVRREGAVCDAASSSPPRNDGEVPILTSVARNVNAIASKPGGRVKYGGIDDPGLVWVSRLCIDRVSQTYVFVLSTSKLQFQYLV
jgi:hypothetical protein